MSFVDDAHAAFTDALDDFVALGKKRADERIGFSHQISAAFRARYSPVGKFGLACCACHHDKDWFV
jgi:hypothetical protein